MESDKWQCNTLSLISNALTPLQKFERRNVKLCGVSCENVKELNDWIEDIKAFYKFDRFNINLLADEDRKISFQ